MPGRSVHLGVAIPVGAVVGLTLARDESPADQLISPRSSVSLLQSGSAVSGSAAPLLGALIHMADQAIHRPFNKR